MGRFLKKSQNEACQTVENKLTFGLTNPQDHFRYVVANDEY